MSRALSPCKMLPGDRARPKDPAFVRTLLVSGLCLLTLHTGCSREMSWRAVDRLIETEYPHVPTVTTDSLSARLSDENRDPPLLLDARSPEEYDVSHLRGARRVDPEATTYPGLDTLARDRPIVVYCSVGYRSAGVVKQLREDGFTNVANLKGSIFTWANEGRPVYRGTRRVPVVHPYDDVWGTLLTDSLHAYEPIAPGS